MKIGLSAKLTVTGILALLLNSTAAVAGLCSGGPWNNVLLYDVPFHSATSCPYIVNSTSWLNSGCNAIYPGSVSLNLGYCEPASPPYEFYAYGDCECPANQYPVCNNTHLVIDSVAQPPISCPLLCSTECSIIFTSGEGQCLGDQWGATPCEQSGDPELRCDCGTWTSTNPTFNFPNLHLERSEQPG